MHGDAALTLARQFYKTTAVVRTAGSGPDALHSVTLSRALFEAALRDLLLDQRGGDAAAGVELYEGHGASWKLARCVLLRALFAWLGSTPL